MQKLTPLRNLLEVTSLASMLIFLLLMLLAWTVPSSSINRVLEEYGLALVIAMLPGWISSYIPGSK
jgi:hypothetical protein